MNCFKSRGSRLLVSILLAICLSMAPAVMLPYQAYAEDAEAGETQNYSLWDIWVVPEIISGARQPASGGMFAWITFDYYYSGELLSNDLNPADFVVQMKTADGEWTDRPDVGIVVLGGEEYYIASFEAIVAAKVPDNTDPYIKKWRIVYKPDSETERLESELIVQAAALEETDDVTAFNNDYCADFKVEQAPWSYEEYKEDHVPPVYIAYVYPDVTTSFKDNGLIESPDAAHSLVAGGGAGIAFPMDEEGRSFETEYFNMLNTDIKLGDADTGEGIAGLVSEWDYMKEIGTWPGAEDLPDETALYNKLASTVCVPDENADEYLSYIVEGTNVFWVSGAGTQERIDQGVSDYILVVVRDWESYGTVKHDWSSEPVWEWKGSDETGYVAASATFSCGNHAGHKCTVRTVVRCTEDGENLTYTASAVFNGKTYTDTKTVPITDNEEDYVPPAQNGAAAPVTVNTRTVNADAVKKAIAAAAANGSSPDTFVIGKNVKKISKGAFKGTNVKTLIVQSKKLTKKSVKGSLKGSKVKTIKVNAGSKKVNKKYAKKYKKFFTKKNAGKKAKVR